MALIHTGSIVSDIRGSVGTETYSRNQGGLFVRTRKGPYENVGDNRVACRDALTALSKLWSSTLTGQQRADWRMYAHQHPRPNVWGTSELTNGYATFIRFNWYRWRDTSMLGFPDAPSTPPIIQPLFSFTAAEAANTLTVDVPPANYDPPPANMDFYAYVGYEQNVGVNFCPNTWRKLDVNNWNGAAWSTDPWTVGYPGTLHAGKKLWTKLIAQYADTGEISRPYQTFAIVEA